MSRVCVSSANNNGRKNHQIATKISPLHVDVVDRLIYGSPFLLFFFLSFLLSLYSLFLSFSLTQAVVSWASASAAALHETLALKYTHEKCFGIWKEAATRWNYILLTTCTSVSFSLCPSLPPYESNILVSLLLLVFSDCKFYSQHKLIYSNFSASHNSTPLVNTNAPENIHELTHLYELFPLPPSLCQWNVTWHADQMEIETENFHSLCIRWSVDDCFKLIVNNTVDK